MAVQCMMMTAMIMMMITKTTARMITMMMKVSVTNSQVLRNVHVVKKAPSWLINKPNGLFWPWHGSSKVYPSIGFCVKFQPDFSSLSVCEIIWQLAHDNIPIKWNIISFSKKNHLLLPGYGNFCKSQRGHKLTREIIDVYYNMMPSSFLHNNINTKHCQILHGGNTM